MELNVKKLIENAKNYPVKFYDKLSLYVVIFDGKIGALHSYCGEKIIQGLIEYQYDLELFYVDSGRLLDKVYGVFGKEGKLIQTGPHKIVFFPKAKLFAQYHHLGNPAYVFFDLGGKERFSSPREASNSSETPEVVNGKYHIFSFMHSYKNNVQLFNGEGEIICLLSKDLSDRDLSNTQKRISTLSSNNEEKKEEYPFIKISHPESTGSHPRMRIINTNGKTIRNDVSGWKFFPEQNAFILQDSDSDLWEIFSFQTGKLMSNKQYVNVEVQDGKLVGAAYEPVQS